MASGEENNNPAGADAGIWRYLAENFRSPAERLDGWVDRTTVLRPAIPAHEGGAMQVSGVASERERRETHASRLAELCRLAGIGEPEVLADTLMLLTEGARDVDGLPEDECLKLNRTCKATIAAFSRQ